MASEIVANSDAQMTELSRIVLEEARPEYVALNFCKIDSIESVPGMVLKYTKTASTSNSGAITDGTALSNTGLTPTSVSITAAGVGTKGVVTKHSVVGSLITLEHVAANFGRALANKIDLDVVTNYSNFSVVVGTSAAPATVANYLSLIYNLEAANENVDMVAVFHQIQWDDMRVAIVAASGAAYSNPGESPLGGIMNAAMAKSYKGTFFGVPVFIDSNVVTTSGNKDGAMYRANRAIPFVWKWMPTFEYVAAPEYPGWTVSAHAAYGTGELFDGAGVLLRTTATA